MLNFHYLVFFISFFTVVHSNQVFIGDVYMCFNLLGVVFVVCVLGLIWWAYKVDDYNR